MIKKKLAVYGDANNVQDLKELYMNPELKKQCVVAVKQEDHYEFMECHFEVWHNHGNALFNTLCCVNTFGLFFPISQLYCDPVSETDLSKIKVCLFDPDDPKDKEILSEISWELSQEYRKDNI